MVRRRPSRPCFRSRASGRSCGMFRSTNASVSCSIALLTASRAISPRRSGRRSRNAPQIPRCETFPNSSNVAFLYAIRQAAVARATPSPEIHRAGASGVTSVLRTKESRCGSIARYRLSVIYQSDLRKVARPAGLEPATPGLEGQCHLSDAVFDIAARRRVVQRGVALVVEGRIPGCARTSACARVFQPRLLVAARNHSSSSTLSIILPG